MLSALSDGALIERPYASTRGQARLLAAIATAQLLSVAATTVADEAGDGGWAEAVSLYGGYVAMLLLFAGVALFVDWARRATDNLRALGTLLPSFSGLQVVLVLMVPLANGVLTALWHESQPRADGTAPQHWLGAPLVTAWLLALCAAIESVMVASGAYERVALLASWLVAGVLFVALVLQTQRRQDEQWRD